MDILQYITVPSG